MRMFNNKKIVTIVIGVVITTICILSPTVLLAQPTDGTWQPAGSTPFVYSTSSDWLDGVIADGVGAEAMMTNSSWYNLDIDSNRTLGSWIDTGGGARTYTTSGGAVLTWDTDDGSDAIFRPLNNSGYNINDRRDMDLQDNLNWGDDRRTEREHNLTGIISGPGKLILDFNTNNYDGFNHGRLNIGNSGDAPNTYAGGTDIAIGSDGTWGFFPLNDPRIANLRKDGALGSGDVNMTRIHANLQIENDGSDSEEDGDNRIDDGAALKLISGYDPDYEHGVKGYFHTNVILNSDVNETVDSLYMNGYQAPAGTYDAASAPIWFRGDGVMTVTNGSPAPANRTSAAAGNWNGGATWGGTAPSYFDESSVGHAVVVAADAAANNVVLTTGGSVTIDAGQTLLVQNSVDPSAGAITVNGTLETVNLASTTGLNVGANGTLTVGQTIVVDNNFDTTTAGAVQLPGGFEGNTITVAPGGVLTLGGDLNRTRNLQVSGNLTTSGNVLMQYGGRLSGSGTIIANRVEIANQGHWQITQVGTGGVTLAPGDSVGVLTVQDGDFVFQSGRSQGGDFSKNKYEWEVGQSGETDVLSVVNGVLNLGFSNGSPDQVLFKILDGGGYVENPTDKLDMFTYDADSTITVNEVGGLVQGIDASSFDTTALDETWTVGILEMWHETLPGGGGHVYLTGLSGGTQVGQTWDGTDAAWNSEHWLVGPEFPVADKDMRVDSGTVTVLSDVSATPGAAKSLSIARDAAGGTVVIDPAGTLAVTGDTTVATGGTLNVNGALSTGGLAVTGGTLGLGAGSMITSPLAAPDLSEVMISVDGTLNAGGGVATIGDEENDLGVTNLTLADGSVLNWTFSSGNDYVDVFGEVTFAGALEIQLVDGGGTANNEDVELFRAFDAAILDLSSVTVLSPVGEGWTWDTNGSGYPLFEFNGEFLVLKGLNTAGGVPGDANGDQVVDDEDLALFEAQFGGTPGGADFDGDGDVDLGDFATLRGNWGFGTGGAPDGGLNVTPEPATMSLLALGGLLVIRRRRRKA